MPSLTPYTDALALALRDAGPVSRTRTVPLAAAAGAVLAGEVVAGFDVPGFARAAMDGYAVRAADVAAAAGERPVRLRCTGETLAGHVATSPVTPGACLAIATGAPLPDGADAVVKIEDTAREGETVLVRAPTRPGLNIDAIGCDLRNGGTVGRRGDVLTPARIGALASVGATTVEVFETPRVVLLATGDEVVEPGKPLGPGQIYETNTASVAALLRQHLPGQPSDPQTLRLPDQAGPLRDAFLRLSDVDLLISTAGTSVGKKDLIPAIVRELGEIVFHGVAVKPGRPLLLAKLRRTNGPPQLFVGLPGFPTSCLMMAYAFLVPVVRKLAGLPPWTPPTRKARLSADVKSPPEMHQFLTVRLDGDRADPAFKASSVITSMSEADGWVEIPEGNSMVKAGEQVEVRLF